MTPATPTPRYAVPSVTLTGTEAQEFRTKPSELWEKYNTIAQLGAQKAVAAINAQAAAEDAKQAPPSGERFVVTDGIVNQYFGVSKFCEDWKTALQRIADDAFAAGVASVNVADIERAAVYAVVREMFRTQDADRYTFDKESIRMLSAKYAPPKPEPVWHEWVRPSDGGRLRTQDSTTWEYHCQVTASQVCWYMSPSTIPSCRDRADFDSLAAFLNEYFPTPEVPQ